MMTPDEILSLVAAHERTHGAGLLPALAPFHPSNWLMIAQGLKRAAEAAGPEFAEYAAAVSAFCVAAEATLVRPETQRDAAASGQLQRLGWKWDTRRGTWFEPIKTPPPTPFDDHRENALRQVTAERDKALSDRTQGDKAISELQALGGSWSAADQCWTVAPRCFLDRPTSGVLTPQPAKSSDVPPRRANGLVSREEMIRRHEGTSDDFASHGDSLPPCTPSDYHREKAVLVLQGLGWQWDTDRGIWVDASPPKPLPIDRPLGFPVRLGWGARAFRLEDPVRALVDHATKLQSQRSRAAAHLDGDLVEGDLAAARRVLAE